MLTPQQLPMSSEDREAQEDELLALASIYDEDVFKRSESAQGGETRIFLELPQDFIVSVNGELDVLCYSKMRFAWAHFQVDASVFAALVRRGSSERQSRTDPVLCSPCRLGFCPGG